MAIYAFAEEDLLPIRFEPGRVRRVAVENLFVQLRLRLIEPSPDMSSEESQALALAVLVSRTEREDGKADDVSMIMAGIGDALGFFVFTGADGERFWWKYDDDDKDWDAFKREAFQSALTDADRVELQLKFPHQRLVKLP